MTSRVSFLGLVAESKSKGRLDSEERDSKKHRNDRRSRSRSRGRAEKEREREKKTSYEGINYSALDALDRAGDRYGADGDRGRDRDRGRDEPAR